MKELENLLNSLIWRGRKPFGEEAMRIDVENNAIIIIPDDFFADDKKVSIRDISSLDSALWQFVCENRLQKDNYSIWGKTAGTTNIPYDPDYTEYRLLESSLIPEEELDKFLVDNIKVE